MQQSKPLFSALRATATSGILMFAVLFLSGCSDSVSVDPTDDGALSALSAMDARAMTPPGEAAGEQGQTIVDVAVSNPNFSILVQALTEAGLVETLAGDGQYTVFAPTNTAFVNLIAELDGVNSASDLLSSPALESILLYHVAPGRRFARTVTKQKRINTLTGSFLFVDGKVLTDANDRTSNIVDVDIPASNGVVHVIDTVVLPPLN